MILNYLNKISWTFLLLAFSFLLLFSLQLLSGCASKDNSVQVGELSGNLIILHAGSLAVPVDKLADEFEAIHPLVQIQSEAAGSRTTARKVSELNRQADLVMSADYLVINTLLIPEFADWNVLFARNSMVIAFTDKSRYAAEITTANWYKILLKEDTTVGRSNPNADPNGYRTLMVWQLAEFYYDLPGLYLQLEQSSPPENIRPKETDLIALLQTGDLDYAFSYLSIATQHELEFVTLPEEINLGSSLLADFYRKAEVFLDGEQPGEFISRLGGPIVYGLTIPKDAPNPNLALAFLTFMFSSEGQDILEDQGLIPLQPPLSADYELLPDNLQSQVSPLLDQ